MKKKVDKLIPLILSLSKETINSRFMVKISIFDNGVDAKSVMVVVCDLLESGFTIKYFKSEEEAANLLKLLNAVSK